ncbi:unnamed protein product [Symbiodinium natans]|uniref:Uncharacterized protein n=1 Tax=Symbiodinium natans TaxID=878477 RepID=A0A812U1L9_9DINO|nr:unnamed protein product [Symbiodinium natans]
MKAMRVYDAAAAFESDQRVFEVGAALCALIHHPPPNLRASSPRGRWEVLSAGGMVVEQLERNYGEEDAAAVTITFRHFPANSRWYRLRVVVGDGVVRRCAIGGYHGGIRAVTPEEDKQWKLFFPSETIMF